jgi:opacity protein-like surface antigen
MIITRKLLAMVVCGLALMPSRAAAQSPADGRLEIAGSAGWMTRSDLGTTSVTLTGNGVPTGEPVTYFDASSEIQSGPRLEGRIAWRLTGALAIEGTASITRTHLRTEISNDVEQAPSINASSTFNEYAIEGGLRLDLANLRFRGGRAQPFVTGGVGYLRHVHDGATLIDTGQSAYAGGGLHYLLRAGTPRSTLKAIGLRGDLRLNIRSGGFETIAGTSTHVAPSLSLGLFVRF